MGLQNQCYDEVPVFNVVCLLQNENINTVMTGKPLISLQCFYDDYFQNNLGDTLNSSHVWYSPTIFTTFSGK